MFLKPGLTTTAFYQELVKKDNERKLKYKKDI